MARASRHEVYTLLVEVGRKAGDGLPEGSTGAAILCYASGVDEAEAVRETVAVLKAADMNPLDVEGFGTAEDQRAEGRDRRGRSRAHAARTRRKRGDRRPDHALRHLNATPVRILTPPPRRPKLQTAAAQEPAP